MGRFLIHVLSSFPMLVIQACTGASDLLSLKELSDVVTRGGGWAVLPVADSKIRPGTIIYVAKDEGMRFVGFLGSCNVPKDILEPVQGRVGTVSFSKEVMYDASALLNIKGVEAGPEFGTVKQVSFEITDFGADAVDLLRLSVWLTDPHNTDAIPAICLEWLDQANIYLVNEAFRISKGKYTLRDSTGAKLSISPTLLKTFLKMGSDAGAQWTNEGRLEITEPVYIAVRKAQKLEGRFATLGKTGPEAEFADGILRGLAEKEASHKEPY